VRERLLLFRVGSGTDWQRAGVTGETVTALVAKGLLVRDGAGRLTLTDDGRAALQALLPGLLVLTLPRLSCWEEIDMALGTVNKLIGNAIELAGIGLALVGIAVASYQCVLRLQDGDWMPLEFRLAWEWLEGSEPSLLSRGAERLRTAILDLPLAVGLFLCGCLAVYLGRTFIIAAEATKRAKGKESPEG